MDSRGDVSNSPFLGRANGSFGINQIQTIQTATFGRFSIFPSVFDPGARYSVDPATPIARQAKQH
jgi:hypothetical protein